MGIQSETVARGSASLLVSGETILPWAGRSWVLTWKPEKFGNLHFQALGLSTSLVRSWLATINTDVRVHCLVARQHNLMHEYSTSTSDETWRTPTRHRGLGLACSVGINAFCRCPGSLLDAGGCPCFGSSTNQVTSWHLCRHGRGARATQPSPSPPATGSQGINAIKSRLSKLLPGFSLFT